jgi:competence protein ComGC
MKINIFKSIKWFTFIELVISITIVAILSVLGFFTYSKSLEDSRDSQRKSEISWVASWFKLYKTKRWEYPTPWSNFNITNSGYLVAIQWKLDENIIISNIDKIPLDPFIWKPYIFSISKNKQEFQIAATLENNWINKSLLTWDYKTVSKNILPTIVLAIDSTIAVEINQLIWLWATNRTKFIFDWTIHNLPYTFSSPFLPYTDSTSFTWLLNDNNITGLQNSDYRSCLEINDDWKNIWTWEYQINSGWLMINSNCNLN